MTVYAMPGIKKSNLYNLSPDQIIKVILEYRKQNKEDVLKRNRKDDFVYTRKLIAHFLYKYSTGSDTELSRYLAPAITHRTTFIHAREQIKDLIETDIDVRFDIMMIKERLEGVN